MWTMLKKIFTLKKNHSLIHISDINSSNMNFEQFSFRWCSIFSIHIFDYLWPMTTHRSHNRQHPLYPYVRIPPWTTWMNRNSVKENIYRENNFTKWNQEKQIRIYLFVKHNIFQLRFLLSRFFFFASMDIHRSLEA